MGSELGTIARMCAMGCGEIEVSVYNSKEGREKNEGWKPQSQACQRAWPADKWHGWCMVA